MVSIKDILKKLTFKITGKKSNKESISEVLSDLTENINVAVLDDSGKIPSSELPSYVDDIIEGYYVEAENKFYEDSEHTIEIPGEEGKIYVDLTTNYSYRWGGTLFTEINVDMSNYYTKAEAQAKIDSEHKLDADLVDDSNSTNKFVSAQEKTTWNGKSVVVPNPTMSGGESSLDGLEIDGVKYKAGGETPHLYRHEVVLARTVIPSVFGTTSQFQQKNQTMVIIDDEPTAYSLYSSNEMNSPFVTKGYFKEFISKIGIFSYNNSGNLCIDTRTFTAVQNERQYNFSQMLIHLFVDASTKTITTAEVSIVDNQLDYARTSIVSDTVTQIF